MPTVIFHRPSGPVSCEGAAGDSIMLVARDNGIDEVIAECGGVLACATCHVHVAPETSDLFSPPSEEEVDMLEFARSPRTDLSRLSCQLILSDDMPTIEITTA